MQFGIFSVSDITRDPVSGETPSEAERIDAVVADRAEGRGGRARRVRDRRAPQPAVLLLLADHPAGLHRGHHQAPDPHHQHHADHDERPGAHRRGVRDAAAPEQGPDGPDARPRQYRPGLSRGSARTSGRACRWPWRTTTCCTGCGARTWWTGRGSSAPRCRASPPSRVPWMTCRRSSGTARSAPRRSPSRPRTTATATSPTTSSGPKSTTCGSSEFYRQRYAHYGHGSEKQAIIGLGGQAYLARNSQDARREFRPYFNEAPVYGHGPSLEEFSELTPLSAWAARPRSSTRP